MDFEARYRAIQSRDTRFDGQFVTAVRSTGIYCRPSCPARTPRRENVAFLPTSAAAHLAGYRACKRCLPEAAPGSPEWDLRGDIAGRAMRLIADGVVDREGVAGLSSRLGYSSRHLSRILTSELGAGPLALSRAQRAHTARMLLVGTDMPIAGIAFAAGFASLRQFNDTVAEVFALTPTQLRSRRRTGPVPAPGAISLALPVREPFDAAGVFAWLRARAVPGVEEASGARYARQIALPGGRAWFAVASEGGRVQLSARIEQLGDLGTLVARVRRLFALDADPVACDDALRRHEQLAAHVGANPGIRMPGAVDGAEMLIRAMVGQQVSVSAARTALSRLTEALGERVEAVEGCDRLFPTPLAISSHGADVLRGPRARVLAVIGAAHALAEGELELGAGDDAAEQRARLLALPGVGPWTADYVGMRVLGSPDVFLPGDVAVRAGALALGLPAGARELDHWARRVSPWRSHLCAHLWRAGSGTPSSRRPKPASDLPAPV